VIRAKLAAERAIARTGNDYDRRIAEANVADLEPLLARQEEGERIRTEREAQRQAEQAALTKQREAERIATLKERYRSAWRAAHQLTDASEYDREDVWKPFLEQKLAEEHAAAVARSKAQMRF
jgi:hypothetical protein